MSKIGGLIIASAIIWGAVIIGCASALKGTQFSLGFDHKLGKKGTVYAMYNTITEKNAATTKDNNTVSVGYILKF